MASHEKFWNKVALKYSKSPVADEAAYQKKLKKTQEYFTPDSNVLEFGCGTGTTALIHAPFVGHIKATDISSAMIEIAKEKLAKEGIQNVSFEKSSVEEMSLPPESYDVVMGHNILHLVEDKKSVINEIYKTLKPGGVFVSSTPCIDDFLRIIKYIFPVGRALGVIPFVKCFTKDELLRDIVDAGFAIEYQWRPSTKQGFFLVATKN
jgi:ubiquinone/menaquinone biosynthesis C-methylase UbiE